uniref:Uncharacterized protein n=1 Tax=Triticum urartu TaxID=4572 RepID=A0A8R7TTA5_TRIUA
MSRQSGHGSSTLTLHVRNTLSLYRYRSCRMQLRLEGRHRRGTDASLPSAWSCKWKKANHHGRQGRKRRL